MYCISYCDVVDKPEVTSRGGLAENFQDCEKKKDGLVDQAEGFSSSSGNRTTKT
jgi:hypothetical protein